jgi:hypothetical protein
MADTYGGLPKNGNDAAPIGRGADARGDDDFEIDIRVEKPIPKPIDKAADVFDREAKRYAGGINTAPSVFSREALFNIAAEDSATPPDVATESQAALYGAAAENTISWKNR